MTLTTVATPASTTQNFFVKLPDEVLTRIMKQHRNDRIHGVLLLDYPGSIQFRDYPVVFSLKAYELRWAVDEGREIATEPVTFPLDLDVVHKILEIRFFNRAFARCMLEAFFKSPMVFQHHASVIHSIKPVWFLPCQIKPQLLLRSTSIKAEYCDELRMLLRTWPDTNFQTSIECANTGINLPLSKEMHLPTVDSDDTDAMASQPESVFVQTPNGLLIRGIQFTGSFEEVCLHLPTKWSEQLIQMCFILLKYPHWCSANIPPGSDFILRLR
jgi:hypothetical protein